MEGLYILMHSTLLSNNNCLRLHAASSAIVNKYWTYASDNVEAEICFISLSVKEFGTFYIFGLVGLLKYFGEVNTSSQQVIFLGIHSKGIEIVQLHRRKEYVITGCNWFSYKRGQII